MRVIFGTDPVKFVRHGDDDEQRWQWTCSICGREGPWARGWQHFSSFAVDDAGATIFVTCSKKCRESERANFMVIASDRIKYVAGAAGVTLVEASIVSAQKAAASLERRAKGRASP